jgi:hypothetical protein
MWSRHQNGFTSFQLFNSDLNLKGTRLGSTYFRLPNIFNTMHTETDRMILPPTYNILEVCKQMSHLKFMYASIQVSNILFLTIGFEVINFNVQIFLPLIYEMFSSFMCYVVHIIYINLAWIL